MRAKSSMPMPRPSRSSMRLARLEKGPMRCVRPDKLADFARQRLPEEERAAVARHLEACAQCRTALGRVSAAYAHLQSAKGMPVPEASEVRTEATLRWLRLEPERR